MLNVLYACFYKENERYRVIITIIIYSVGFFESDFHSFSHSERHIVWFISFAFLEKIFKKSLKNCLYDIQKKSGT